VLAKPNGSQTLGEVAYRLAYHVKAAARARRRPVRPESGASAAPPVPESVPPGEFSARRVILIGASTGGVEALRELLPRLPGGLPPIAVVQHIPPTFSRIMAEHLNKLCRFEVREASDGDELRRGLCLVAPGDFHLTLVPWGRGYRARLTQSPPVHHCRPAVDVLFRSAADHAGAAGRGRPAHGDGGGRRPRHARAAGGGRPTLVEHEDSCVVYGMPQAAIKLGAADEVVPLPKMPQAILQALARPVRS